MFFTVFLRWQSWRRQWGTTPPPSNTTARTPTAKSCLGNKTTSCDLSASASHRSGVLAPLIRQVPARSASVSLPPLAVTVMEVAHRCVQRCVATGDVSIAYPTEVHLSMPQPMPYPLSSSGLAQAIVRCGLKFCLRRTMVWHMHSRAKHCPSSRWNCNECNYHKP